MFTTTREIINSNKLVPAFNFSTPEVARAIVSACAELNAPVILQTSEKEAEFLAYEIAGAVARHYGNSFNTSVSLQLDHLKDLESVDNVDLGAFGYSSVMLDLEGSSFEDSISQILRFKKTHPTLLIEANLEYFDRASEYTEKSGIDLLAPEIHNFVEIDSLANVAETTMVPLVLHGCSKKTDEEIKEAVKLGIRKVNFNTELRFSWLEAIRKKLSSDEDLVKPYDLLALSEESVKSVVINKLKILGF